MSNEFKKIIEECQEIHDKKSHDYASETNKYSNFEEAANITKLFKRPIDQVFAGIIAIKLSRLGQLSNGKEAKNESIRDTRLDLINYCILWAAYYDSFNAEPDEYTSGCNQESPNDYGFAEPGTNTEDGSPNNPYTSWTGMIQEGKYYKINSLPTFYVPKVRKTKHVDARDPNENITIWKGILREIVNNYSFPICTSTTKDTSLKIAMLKAMNLLTESS